MPLSKSLYAPYRSLGLVCDGSVSGCAPSLHRQGTASFLTTPVSGGRSLHLYDVSLHLKLVSKPFPSSWPSRPISRLAAAHDLTFVALGAAVGVLKRLSPVALWENHNTPLTQLFVAGDVLVSVCEEGRLLAWRIPASAKRAVPAEGHVLADIALPLDFKVAAVTHPPTYMNKVLLAARDGRCLLINLRTKKIVHEFESFGAQVTALVPSLVLDVVAVGLADGRLLLHNFRADETVITFRHSPAEGATEHVAAQAGLPPHAVMGIAFRSDGDESVVSADAEGNLFVWDLNEKRLRSEARGVHPGSAALVSFLPGEPVLFTAGGQDNAVKVHMFDGASGEARVLRSREGHRLPPTLVRFCGYDGSMMVSAGLDRELRMVSIVREARNRTFAQTAVENRGKRAKKRRRVEAGLEKGDQRLDLAKRLPPILAIASNDLRQRDVDFANIVTVHVGLREAFMWRMQNGATHGHVLVPPDGPEKYQLAFKRGPKPEAGKKKKKNSGELEDEERCATCVVLSPCGNYAIVGAQDGRIHSYNLQSGLHQGVYGDASLEENVRVKKMAEDDHSLLAWEKAHASSVVGVSVDGCGDVLVSAGTDDSLVKFWNMHGRLLDNESITTPARVGTLRWCKTSDLLAISCDDFCIYVYDASTKKLARKFAAHAGPIVDMCFDPQGRRIISAAMDGTVRTWDLPSGRVIDTLSCSDAPTSIAVAPSGEYLATTHVNKLGISLWVDTSKFGSLFMLDHQHEADDVTVLDSVDDSDGAIDSEASDEADKSGASATAFPNGRTKGPDEGDSQPLSANVATLSSKPLTHWTTLSNLQAIKERNKPVEPAKKAESAPFFLPTVKGIKMQFAVSGPSEEDSKINTGSKTKPSKYDSTGDGSDWANSEFGRLVAQEQYGSAAQLLRGLDASGVDLEIRTLDGEQSRRNAAIFFKEKLGSPQECELTQAHLSVFLSAHGTLLARDEGGTKLLEDVSLAQEKAWQKLRSAFDSVLTLSAYFSGQV